MQHAEVTLPGLTSSVPTARSFVQERLAEWGLTDLQWPAALCVSELAANSVLHARSAFTLVLTAGQDEVLMAVRDASRAAPVMRDYGAAATTGRGLQLVERLSRGWGVELDDDGKTVWLLLAEDADGSGRRAATDSELSADDLLAAYDDEPAGDGGTTALTRGLAA